MTIYWTSEDCHGQAIFTLHLSVGQVIIFPYFDHWRMHHLEIRGTSTSNVLSSDISLSTVLQIMPPNIV